MATNEISITLYVAFGTKEINADIPNRLNSNRLHWGLRILSWACKILKCEPKVNIEWINEVKK